MSSSRGFTKIPTVSASFQDVSYSDTAKQITTAVHEPLPSLLEALSVFRSTQPDAPQEEAYFQDIVGLLLRYALHHVQTLTASDDVRIELHREEILKSPHAEGILPKGNVEFIVVSK